MPSITGQRILSEAQEQRIEQVVRLWFTVTLILFICFLLTSYFVSAVTLKYMLVGLTFLVQFFGLFQILIIKQRKVFRSGRSVQKVAAVLLGLSAMMTVAMVMLLI